MSDQSQTTTDSSGVTRTQDGTIADQSTSVRSETTTDSSQGQTDQTETQSKTDSKGTTWLTNNESEGEVKTEGKKEGEGEETKTEAKPGAPEKYETFKLPEGSTIDQKMMEKAEGVFRNLGLSQDQAQDLMSLYGEQIAEFQKALAAPTETYVNLRNEWKEGIASDPEMGPRQKEVKAAIGTAIASLDAKTAAAFREAVDFTGVGDHPGFVRAMWKFSQILSEGTVVRGKGPAENGQRASGEASSPSAAQAIYPHLKSNG